VRDFAFAAAPAQLVPAHKPSTLVIAVLMHALAVAALMQVKTAPARVTSAGSPEGGIAVSVAGPIASAAAPKPAEAKTALKTDAAKDTPKDVDPAAGADAGSQGVVGPAQASTGPVRLGSGGSITLVRRVQPVYPPMMQSARATGQVVLDAIIHADGTIGDITVLRSTNEAFARSASDAVKR